MDNAMVVSTGRAHACSATPRDFVAVLFRRRRQMLIAFVAVLITVQDAGGKELWSGLVTGEAKRWGRSYNEENYMETLSDALVRAIDGFLSDPQLKVNGSETL